MIIYKHISERAFIFDKRTRLLISISGDQQIEFVFSSKDRSAYFRLMDSFSRSYPRHLRCKHNYSSCLDKIFSRFHFDQTTIFDYPYRHYQHASLISEGREIRFFFLFSRFYFASVKQVYKPLNTAAKSHTLRTSSKSLLYFNRRRRHWKMAHLNINFVITVLMIIIHQSFQVTMIYSLLMSFCS